VEDIPSYLHNFGRIKPLPNLSANYVEFHAIAYTTRNMCARKFIVQFRAIGFQMSNPILCLVPS
jgi:hypothetical protein